MDWRAQVLQAQSGDLASFDMIVRRFRDMAVGYAYSVLGDCHLAEDVAQEAFIGAYHQLTALREPAAFPAWFRRIIFKHCDRITRRRRVATVALSEEAAGSLQQACKTASLDPAESVTKREVRQAVLDAVAALRPQQREAAALYYINGYSLGEVGDFLGVPLSTVKSRVYSARQALQKEMIGLMRETLRERAPGEDFNKRVRRVLEQVPRVGFYSGGDVCPEDITFPSCMAAVMRYLGTDYPWLPLVAHNKAWRLNYGNVFFVGVTGIGFGLLWKQGWHGDNVDMMNIAADPEQVIRRAFAAAGHTYEYIRRSSRTTEASWSTRIIASIDRGIPVLAFGVMGPPECCVVTGYDDDGQVLLGWNFFQNRPEFGGGGEAEPSGYFRKRGWFADTQALILIGEPTSKQPLAETYRSSLAWALEVMRTPLVLGRSSGVAAWQAWASQLEGEEAVTDDFELLRHRHRIHDSQIGNTAECRAWASKYIRQMAEDEPRAAAELNAAADSLMAVHDMMWEVWGLMGEWRSPDAYLEFAKPEVRRMAAGILMRAMAEDQETAKLLARALTVMG